MTISSVSKQAFNLFLRLSGFLLHLLGLHKFLGNETIGFQKTKSIMNPVYSLDDEWKNIHCDCSIKVSEVDLTLF